MFIFTRTLVTYARTIFKPRCCLNFQSMRTQAESTYIAHNMFEQIKMEKLWYINRHMLISRKRDGKPRMIGGQFVVVRVGVHQLSVSSNTSHPMLQICSKLLHGNSMPSLNRLDRESVYTVIILIKCISRLFSCMSLGCIVWGYGLAAPSARLSRATLFALLADLV